MLEGTPSATQASDEYLCPCRYRNSDYTYGCLRSEYCFGPYPLDRPKAPPNTSPACTLSALQKLLHLRPQAPIRTATVIHSLKHIARSCRGDLNQSPRSVYFAHYCHRSPASYAHYTSTDPHDEALHEYDERQE
jgi:hypothetical protein